MRCPFCNFEDTKVIDSRPADGRKRRRRECGSCQKRFTTYECVELPLLMVQKRDGSFEPFDSGKLIQGVYRAIKKRPVDMQAVQNVVSIIENKCANELRTQITSREIGDIILEQLKTIDEVAYIRFASVYEDFTDVDGFIKAITALRCD